MKEKRGLLDRIAFSLDSENQPPSKQISKGSQGSKHRAGDWVCLLCNNHNYSFRKTCNRCKGQTKEQNILQSLSFLQNQNQNLNMGQGPFLSQPSYAPPSFYPSYPGYFYPQVMNFRPYESQNIAFDSQPTGCFETQKRPFEPRVISETIEKPEEPTVDLSSAFEIAIGESEAVESDEALDCAAEEELRQFTLTQSHFWRDLNLDN